MSILRIATGLVLIPLLFTGGCVVNKPRMEENYRPVPPPAQVAPPQANGAIYQSGTSMLWFEDLKARRVGDLITVVLMEATSASKSASTSTSKENDVNMANPSLLGSNPRFNAPGLLPLASNKQNDLSANLNSSQDFSGQGDTSQSNSLSGNITVTVAQVLPNGNLLVRGEKWLTLNQGEEYVQISGIVRPVDVTANNQVLSTQVADARITYSGKGMVADSNKMGWLGRFFLSGFWPF